jgi:DNA ligase (NAD+)
LGCDGVGIKTADKIWEGIQSLIEEMTETLKYVQVYVEEKKTGGLAGMSFCFTGALNTMKRAEAEKLVVDHGGEVKSGVSKGLTYLVTNTPNSGSSKNVKAAQLGTTLITEEQFLTLLNE